MAYFMQCIYQNVFPASLNELDKNRTRLSCMFAAGDQLK